MARIDFDKLLTQGLRSYEREVGDWWVKQSDDAPHRRAYDIIATHVARAVKRSGAARGLVVDYGCGDGKLLERLARLLPEARIVGLDGAQKLLARNALRLRAAGHDADLCDPADAFQRGGPRIRLVRTFLPSFALPKGKADAVVFCFPNITASNRDQPHYDKHGYKNPRDVAVAKMLARFREMDPEDENTSLTYDEQYDDLLTNKVISRELRAFLKPGGRLVRVEYANGAREELSELTNWRTLFAESALDGVIRDKRPECHFKYLGNRYYRSKVIMDVYHQTRDESDKEGGYFIADFAAV